MALLTLRPSRVDFDPGYGPDAQLVGADPLSDDDDATYGQVAAEYDAPGLTDSLLAHWDFSMFVPGSIRSVIPRVRYAFFQSGPDPIADTWEQRFRMFAYTSDYATVFIAWQRGQQGNNAVIFDERGPFPSPLNDAVYYDSVGAVVTGTEPPGPWWSYIDRSNAIWPSGGDALVACANANDLVLEFHRNGGDFTAWPNNTEPTDQRCRVYLVSLDVVGDLPGDISGISGELKDVRRIFYPRQT